jgi:hypothetical protein
MLSLLLCPRNGLRLGLFWSVNGPTMLSITRFEGGFLSASGALLAVQGSFDCGCSLRFARRTILAQDDNV